MTNQTVLKPISKPSDSAVRAARSNSNPTADPQSRLLEAMKSQYQLDQQVKFLHLQAETETLLQQLQVLKQQRQGAEDCLDRTYGTN
jgi:hypothetical protein